MGEIRLPFLKEDRSGSCPYKVGELVYYTPSYQGYCKTVMDAPRGQPYIGQRVKVLKVVKDNYIVYEGYDHPAGGIYWTEFSSDPPSIFPFDSVLKE